MQYTMGLVARLGLPMVEFMPIAVCKYKFRNAFDGFAFSLSAIKLFSPETHL